jgi:hypothetical protein
MKLISFRIFLRVLYALGFIFVAVVATTGLPYYTLSLAERTHSAMHSQLKPGGVWGHGLGIVGSAMLILLLLYSVRKRRKLGLHAGGLNRWLDIHIFLGVMGPLLITLHTAMKFHGIVSISFFSMVAVALSGVFGRYIYMQIPRDARGHALDLNKARSRVEKIQEDLSREHKLSENLVQSITQFAGVSNRPGSSRTRAILHSIGRDLTLNSRTRRLHRSLRRSGTDLPDSLIDEVVALAKESSLLERRIAQVDSMNEMFHYWHIFHKPFAVIMYIIMVLHVGVAVAFGYRWIF